MISHNFFVKGTCFLNDSKCQTILDIIFQINIEMVFQIILEMIFVNFGML